MHGRSPLAAAVLLLVGTLLAVAAPAQADTILIWRLEQRPAGLPATTEPARTLARADADLTVGRDGSTLRATVELGDVPTAETGADLHLRIGTPQDGTCRTDWEVVVPTFDPSGPASREGAAIRIVMAMAQPTDTGTHCASAVLTAADGSVLDQLDDAAEMQVVADAGARARIERVTGTRVRRGHWSTVWVRIGHRGADADGVEVTGAGRGVRVRRYTVRVSLRAGDEVWAPLQVRLRGGDPRTVTFSARPFGDIAFAFPGTREVLLRPAR